MSGYHPAIMASFEENISCYNPQTSKNFQHGGCPMEITVQEFKHCDMISIKGRVDSATAPQLAQALEAANEGGKYKLVVNMDGLEYMSSAGFRALLAAQRNCKRYNRGEVVLAVVPVRIREALELAGFTELFKTFDDTLAAVGHF
jgi:anti-sigma B factor antagonist